VKANWREILEQNEEKVKDGIKRSVRTGMWRHFGNEYTSEIDTAGNVNCYEYVGGQFPVLCIMERESSRSCPDKGV